jgi:hypothetical protein
MHRLVCVIAICAVGLLGSDASLAAAAPQSGRLDEALQRFSVGGEPVPPEIFRDFGDGDLADSGPIWVAVDLDAATGSNLYADPIKTNGAWVMQTKKASAADASDETTAYKRIGVAANGLLVVVASYSGGGTGVFYTLHTLDIAEQPAFDADGKPVRRLTATLVRSIALGDRWSGEVEVSGNTIKVGTMRQGPADDSAKLQTTTYEALRP